MYILLSFNSFLRYRMAKHAKCTYVYVVLEKGTELGTVSS